MSDERIYKYAILRNREGEYVIPYSGVHGLADVAFTGKYSDLIDAPDETNSYLPAIVDKTGDKVKYYVNNQTIFNNEEVLLDYVIDYITDEGTQFEDLTEDVNAVNTKYVHDVAHYLVDNLQEQLDRALEEAQHDVEPPVDPWSDIPRVYRGVVANKAALNADSIIQNVHDGDVYFVADERVWYMYVAAAEGNWVAVDLS